jgi:hypothetical protein
MATKTYIVAENWGKGFIEHSESAKFTISGLPGNVWQVPAHNKDANLWISKVLGVVKTKAEAQAIVDAEVQAHKLLGTLYLQKNKLELADQLT